MFYPITIAMTSKAINVYFTGSQDNVTFFLKISLSSKDSY